MTPLLARYAIYHPPTHPLRERVCKLGLGPFRKRTCAPLGGKSNGNLYSQKWRTSALSKRIQIRSFCTILVAGGPYGRAALGLGPFRKRTCAPLAGKSNCQFVIAEGAHKCAFQTDPDPEFLHNLGSGWVPTAEQHLVWVRLESALVRPLQKEKLQFVFAEGAHKCAF